MLCNSLFQSFVQRVISRDCSVMKTFMSQCQSRLLKQSNHVLGNSFKYVLLVLSPNLAKGFSLEEKLHSQYNLTDINLTDMHLPIAKFSYPVRFGMF